MAKLFIRQFSKSLSSESKRFGKRNVKAAVDEFSRRVNEIAARSKGRILKRALAQSSDRSVSDSRTGAPPVRHEIVAPSSIQPDVATELVTEGRAGASGLTEAQRGEGTNVESSQAIQIRGPDDAELLITRTEGCYLWSVRNAGLRSIEQFQLELCTTRTFDAEKLAFREPENLNFQWPVQQHIGAGDLRKAGIFLRVDGDNLCLWNSDDMPVLRWPSGDQSPLRRWCLNMRITGLSKEWPIELLVQWMFGAKTFELMQCSTQEDALSMIEGERGSSFWRALRTEFNDLATRQRSILREDTRREWLEASCRFFKEDGPFGRCLREGGLDGDLISQFEYAATRGACALGWPPDVNDVKPVEFWIYRLSQNLLKAQDPLIKKEFSGDETIGCIQGLLESSAGYCSRLAAAAERDASESRSRSIKQSKGTEGVPKPEPTTPSQPTAPAEVVSDASDATTAPLVENFDFASEPGRITAIAEYVKRGDDCPEASLARTAKVHPADLSKWKKGLLPAASDKKARIETALRNNDPPTPAARRDSDT